jgi:hypothetical protein
MLRQVQITTLFASTAGYGDSSTFYFFINFVTKLQKDHRQYNFSNKLTPHNEHNVLYLGSTWTHLFSRFCIISTSSFSNRESLICRGHTDRNIFPSSREIKHSSSVHQTRNMFIKGWFYVKSKQIILRIRSNHAQYVKNTTLNHQMQFHMKYNQRTFQDLRQSYISV